MDTISKAAYPGKFKDKKKWLDCEPAFVNDLSTIPGAREVPLSYAVRENAANDHETDFGNDFIACLIALHPFGRCIIQSRFVEFWGLPPFILLYNKINWLVWEVGTVN